MRVIDGPFANFTGHGRRGEGREAEDSRQRFDLRPRHAGRARLRAGRESRRRRRRSELVNEEDHRFHQAPGSRRQGQPVAAHRAGAGSARRQHHGVLQAVQRPHAGADQGRRHDPGRDHGLLGPLVHLHHQDAAGADPDQEGGRPGDAKKPGSGSKEPNKVKVGKITQKQLRDIATTKMPDLNTTDLEAAMRTIAGTARSMGIEVEGYASQRAERKIDGRKHGKKFKKRRPPRSTATKRYPLDEACKLVPETKVAKFDESVDIAVRLGVDPKHADQMVRGAVVLPHGTGKSQRVRRGRQGRQGQRGQGRRRRRRRRRGPGREDPEGELDRLRLDGRDPRHDGSGRPPRPRARSRRA